MTSDPGRHARLRLRDRRRLSPPRRSSPQGVGGGTDPCRRVAHDGIAALVSDVPAGRSLPAATCAHTGGCLEEVAASTTVLPVRFGTVMESDTAVRP